IAQSGGWLVQSSSGAAGEILVGESAVAVFRMVLAPDVPPSTNIDNTVTLSGNPSLSESAVMPTVTVGGAAHTVTVSPNMVVSSCDTVSYSITLTASGSDAFDTYYEFLSQDGLSLVPGSVSVTNTGTGATDTSDPDISGNTWTFNYDGVGYNPGNNPVWDVADGQTVTIAFQILVVDCAPGAKTVATNPYYKAGENAAYIALASEQSDIDILEGAITVEKTSTAPPAAVGDSFTYDIAVRSVGFGDAGNIVLSDNMRPGITYLPGSTVPPADSTFLNGDGSLDLFWLPANHAGLRNLEPGQSFEVTLGAQLNACVDYDDVVTATWGCGPEPCQTVEATASVTLLLDEPDLEYIVNPNPIVVPSCDGVGTTTTFTVRNNGGPAYNLDFTFSGLAAELDMSNFVGDATFIAGSPDTIRIGAIAAGDSAVFTFDLSHNDNCTTPSGTMIFFPTYENSCGDPYSKSPFAVSYSTEGIPSLSVTKTGSDLEVDPGDTTSFTLDVCFGPDAPTNDVFVEDIVPGFLTVLAGTISPPPTSVSGDTLRWTIAPGAFVGGPPSYCVSITYDAEATGTCGSDGANQASAETQVPCGAVVCDQSDAASSIIGIVCPPSSCVTARMTHLINGLTSDVIEVCTPMTHTATVVFDHVTDPLLGWEDLTFIADADSGKTLVGYEQLDGTHKPGVARFFVTDGAGDSCYVDLEPTRNGADELVWDMSSFANGWTVISDCDFNLVDAQLSDITIRVEYDLISVSPIPYHFEYARLEISGGGSCDGTLREAVQPTIGRSVSTVGLVIPSSAERCAVTTLDITVDVGATYESYDHVLYFSNDDFEVIDDPNDPGFFEPIFVGLPDVGVPTRIADVGNGDSGVFWKLGDLPAGTSGVITIPVRKRCTDGTSYARLVYDDKCGDDDTDNVNENPYVSTATGTPTLIFSGDVSIETTPETYFATADTAQWITYAINGGSGGAYNLDLDYQTGGSSIKFIDFQVFNNSGTQLDPDTLTIVYGQDAFSATVTIDHVPAGETWSVQATAVILNCEDKDFSVQGSWGCNGDVCQTGPQLYDTAALDIPETLIIADLPDTYFVASCEAESLSVTLKNASQVIAKGVNLNLLLPPGLSYVDNTTRISINHVGGATAPTVIHASGNDADPAVNGQTLGWFLENVLSTDYLSPEDIVTFTVDLLAAPDFAGGTVGTGGTYTSACGQPAFALGDEVSASTNYFDSTAVSTSANIDSVQACTIDGVDDNTFRLTFSNSAGNGPVYGPLDLQVDLPEGVEYVSFTTNITYEDLADGAQVYTTNASTSGSGAPGDAQTLTWSLPANARVDGGDDITVEFRANFRSDALCAPPARSLDFSIEGARCEDGLPNNVRVQLGPYPNAFQLKTPELSTALAIVDISGTSSTAPGDTVQATVTITNTGNGIARDLALQFEDLGSYVTFLSSSPNRNGGASGADIWTWNTALGELAPGASVVVTIDAEVAGDISFGIPVILEARASEGCCQGTSEAQESFDINPETQLDIEKAAAQSAVVPGELVTYILTVRNHGSQSFQNVVIGETAMPGMTYVSSQFDANNVAYTPAGPIPGWTIAGTASGHDPFAPGDFEVIRVTYRADSNYNAVGTPAGSGSLANTASIASVEDLSGGNVTDPDVLDSDDELLPVELPNALLDLDKVSTTGSVIPGGEMTYHVTVTNPGNVALTNVTVTETFPAGLVFSSAQFDSTVTQLTNATYQIATLEPGQLEVISLNFAVPADSSLYSNPVVNTVNASGTDPSGNTVNAQEAATSNVVSTTGPAIDITKVVLEGAVQRGDLARFLITVVNSGADTLTNVVVTDTPDAGLSFYGVSADTTVATVALGATIPVMPPGHVETISMMFTVDLSAPLSVLNNVAAVSATTASGGTIG
ncbi:MAG: DUF11 domain-containing protein, partial [Candidatus Eisenbacteria bacterium]|nr:DUF11 domain-containing protein [Candidatus Eisenbacteria bacterium]